MKKILLFMMSVLGVLSFSSCSDDSDGLTDIIYYPHLTVTGDEFFINPIGQAYTDQGCTATYNGEDYTSNVVTTGLEDIDVNTPGLYTVTYTATSPKTDLRPQGYSMSATRTVAVCDPTVTTDLGGTWTTQSGSSLVSGANTLDFKGTTATITYLCPGIFRIDDFLANELETQEYSDYAGQGYDFKSGGMFQLTSDNKLILLSSDEIGAFSGERSVTELSGTYDPNTETITFDATVTRGDTGATWRTYHIVLKK